MSFRTFWNFMCRSIYRATHRMFSLINTIKCSNINSDPNVNLTIFFFLFWNYSYPFLCRMLPNLRHTKHSGYSGWLPTPYLYGHFFYIVPFNYFEVLSVTPAVLYTFLCVYNYMLKILIDWLSGYYSLVFKCSRGCMYWIFKSTIR